MNTLTFGVQQKTHQKTFTVELDAEKFIKLAAVFGMFNPEFIKSIERSEQQFKDGKYKKISSLKELRKNN